MTQLPRAVNTTAVTAPPPCLLCRKPAAFCLCADVAAAGKPINNQIALLILQHPQEQDVDLGTAHLTALHFKDATIRIGLSWPSLGKALGRTADPKRWAVLYLGSVKAKELAPGREIVALNRKAATVADQADALSGLDGVIVLDGTWSQAKALWWRNPWMLKAQRVALNPRWPSRYGKLRREPRRDGLSTLEATALLLSRLENKPEIETALIASFDKLLARARALEHRAEKHALRLVPWVEPVVGKNDATTKS